MKTELEIVMNFLEEDQRYQALVQQYQGNDDALAEADWIYQDGVRVSGFEQPGYNAAKYMYSRSMENKFSYEEVVLVDDANIPVGTMAKRDVHTDHTPLHRGFSVYLFDRQGRLLLQQRSHTKQTWPLVWSNSCCGHPGPGEAVESAIRRRVAYELGINEIAQLQEVLPYFRYSCVREGVMENEICPVWAGEIDVEAVRPNPDEVEAVRWVVWNELAADIRERPGTYSEWCEEQVREMAGSPNLIRYQEQIG